VAVIDYSLQNAQTPTRRGNLQPILELPEEQPSFGSGRGLMAAAGSIFSRDQLFESEDELGPVQIKVPAEVPVVEDGLYKAKLSFISGLIAAHRPSIQNVTEVAKYIVELSAHASIDPFYVAAVISVESRFGESAKSKVGALGLMQLMPDTAKEVMYLNTGVKELPELRDGRTNIALGIDYLKRLEKRYRGDRALALAAYNWGPGNISSVKGDFNRAPGEVKKYANTIIERSQQWRTHFARTHKASVDLPA
jgi:soluble lytic murein transglycosylase-like protein